MLESHRRQDEYYYYGTWRGNTKYDDSIDRRAYPTTTTFFWLAMLAAQSQSDGCLDAPVMCRGVTEQDLLSSVDAEPDEDGGVMPCIPCSPIGSFPHTRQNACAYASFVY